MSEIINGAPADWCYEIIGGQKVLMAPPRWNHKEVATRLFHAIYKSLTESGSHCDVYMDPNIILEEDQHEYIPDLAVICDRNRLTPEGYRGAPALVIEILSPKTAKRDRYEKFAAYELCGVREYWIVDIKTKSIEQYVLTDFAYALQAVYILPGEGDIRREEDKEDYITAFRSAVFDSMEINLYDVFSRLI
jgi:Uma2 family endonuclease